MADEEQMQQEEPTEQYKEENGGTELASEEPTETQNQTAAADEDDDEDDRAVLLLDVLCLPQTRGHVDLRTRFSSEHRAVYTRFTKAKTPHQSPKHSVMAYRPVDDIFLKTLHCV
ncbi:hypothetical protein RRG08_030586 [Elysia crispata]|uniref:Uncharacterized protein n=1 Tax=Elysia crispata TaxID=231223 RepID=A0AAE1CS81_9GAST|nr:hypothetical protein RRG08_030586 [Elysia crispata]